MHDALIISTIKLAALMSGLGLVAAASSLPDASVLLNVLTVVLLIIFGPRYVRTTKLKQQIEELKNACEIAEISKRAVSEDLIGVQARADHVTEKLAAAEKDNAEWKARYDEQHRYTAGPALLEIKELLAGNQKFYEEIVSDNRDLIALIHSRISNQPEG